MSSAASGKDRRKEVSGQLRTGNSPGSYTPHAANEQDEPVKCLIHNEPLEDESGYHGNCPKCAAEIAARRPRWSKYDAAHGARIRMILDGEDKGSWVAYCLDCDWKADDPMPPEAAGHVAQQHEEEARHAYA